MFFLLRVAFWLTIVLALLPSGTLVPKAPNPFGATEAIAAAGAAVSDVSGFCDRQREACEVGTQAAVAIGHRAQAGAKMVYEFFNEHGARGETASTARPASMRTASTGSQNTLKASDIDLPWQAPHADTMPMPRKDPRRNKA